MYELGTSSQNCRWPKFNVVWMAEARLSFKQCASSCIVQLHIAKLRIQQFLSSPDMGTEIVLSAEASDSPNKADHCWMRDVCGNLLLAMDKVALCARRALQQR